MKNKAKYTLENGVYYMVDGKEKIPVDIDAPSAFKANVKKVAKEILAKEYVGADAIKEIEDMIEIFGFGGVLKALKYALDRKDPEQEAAAMPLTRLMMQLKIANFRIVRANYAVIVFDKNLQDWTELKDNFKSEKEAEEFVDKFPRVGNPYSRTIREGNWQVIKKSDLGSFTKKLSKHIIAKEFLDEIFPNWKSLMKKKPVGVVIENGMKTPVYAIKKENWDETIKRNPMLQNIKQKGDTVFVLVNSVGGPAAVRYDSHQVRKV